MSAASVRWGQRGPRYRRRRPVPALVLLGTLVLISGFVWTNIFEGAEDIEAATTCNRPSPPTSTSPPTESQEPDAPASLGRMLPRDALDRTNPIPPQDVPVRVLNGNGESRQAALISSQLSGLGFTQGGTPSNDPLYPNYDLECHGQIRFGSAGAGAARTLSLVAPCAQLVRDEREDTSVDLSLGSEFDDIKTTMEAKQILQELKTWASQREEQGDAQQQANPPRINAERLSKARDVYC